MVELDRGLTVYAARGLSKTWRSGRSTVPGLVKVDIDIRASEYLVVQGRSGSGKSTLLHVLAGLDRPHAGELNYLNRDLARMSDRQLTGVRRISFGFVFQTFHLIPTLTAAENIEAALAPARLRRSVRRGRVNELLDEVGLTHRARHLPSELSGGEQQRVAVARAMANGPTVLFADEPTGNLDSHSRELVLDVILRLARVKAMSVVLVTHDPAVARGADRVLTMSDGHLN